MVMIQPQWKIIKIFTKFHGYINVAKKSRRIIMNLLICDEIEGFNPVRSG